VASADLAEFLRAHGMSVPNELASARERPIVVLVEDDPGYLKALCGPSSVKRRTWKCRDDDGRRWIARDRRVSPIWWCSIMRCPISTAVQVVERLVDTSKRLTAPVMIVTGGMRRQPRMICGDWECGRSSTRWTAWGWFIEAMRRALQSRKVGVWAVQTGTGGPCVTAS